MSIIRSDTRPRASLVVRQTPEQLTAVQLVDARTALSRALGEYIQLLEITAPEGRSLAFKRVTDVWAEPETSAVFPAAAVFPQGELMYEPGDMTSRLIEIEPYVVLRQWAFGKMDIQVQVWTNDPEERLMLAQLLENAFNPVEWCAGFTLQIPYYFNARAQYLLKSSMYEDDSESAQKRWRRVTLTLEAEIPALVSIGRVPHLAPAASVKVVE